MVFPLVRTRQWRRSDTWEALWGLVVLGAGGYWLVRGFLAAPNLWLQVGAVVGGLVLLTFFGSAAWSEMKETFGRPGRIELTSSEIVLDSPKWFRQPLKVPLNQVRLVTVDEASGDKRRFPIEGVAARPGNKDRETWLWRKDREEAIPQLELNPLDEVPNLAIVFNSPIELKGNKTLKTFLAHLPSFVSRSVRAVTARVEDSAQARQAFADLGLLRPPSVADAVALQPSPEEKRQARRFNVIAMTVTVLLIGGWIGGGIWYMAKGD